MKRFICAIMSAVLLLMLASCGGPVVISGDSPSTKETTPAQTTTNPLVIAEQEYNSAIQSLVDAQVILQERIPAAEELLETVTERDVDDPSVLENLRNIKILATGILEEPIPEMKSDAEEIRQQVISISEQSDTAWNIFYDLDYAIVLVTESQQRWKDASRSEIIMVRATMSNSYNYTIYAIDPETGEERIISDFSIPSAVIANADGSKWQTYPMFIPSYNSKLPLRGMFSTDYNYMAVTRYSLETGEYRAGFYKEGEGLYYTDVTKAIGAVGGDFDDPTVQLALGFTDNNQFIFANLPNGTNWIYKTEDWEVSQVKVSDSGNVGSLQSYNDLDNFLMQGDSWNWMGKNWELTDWIDDTRCLINYPEESVGLLFGGDRIDRWGVRIFDVVTQELSSIIPGESRSNWSGVISPDGKSVAFLSAPANGTGNAALYVTSVNGGEPVKVLDDISSARGTTGYTLTRPTTGKTVYCLLEWRKAG